LLPGNWAAGGRSPTGSMEDSSTFAEGEVAEEAKGQAPGSNWKGFLLFS